MSTLPDPVTALSLQDNDGTLTTMQDVLTVVKGLCVQVEKVQEAVDRLAQHKSEGVFDNSNDRYLTLSEAAVYCGVATRTFRRYLAAGRFRGYRLPNGGSLRFRKDELDRAFVLLPDLQAQKG